MVALFHQRLWAPELKLRISPTPTLQVTIQNIQSSSSARLSYKKTEPILHPILEYKGLQQCVECSRLGPNL